ncbi:hypothetical protein [Gordonia humi]|uniref:DUF4878 domain-containing protein n=1 Tax=Gordonia humi TaxID=686429 RepID=A0A840ERU7_9ACTN|nr:hypothetical protein [Gordonia humi]MBB4134422.1 hypothetical protein [Gordonia humi]
MPDSDNDKSAAIDKVVGAFRARREQAKDEPADESTTPADEPTPVVKLDGAAAALQPKGGDSESPTRAFKVPAQVTAAAGESSDDTETSDEATSDDATSDDAASDEATSDADASASADADDHGSPSDGLVEETDGLVEETVVGEELSADAPETDVSETDARPSADDSQPKPEVVEESVDLVAAESASEDDAAAAETKEPETEEPETESSADATPTEQIAVPAAAAAAAAAATTAKISTQKPSAPRPTAPAPAQPGPQVIAPATEPAKKGRGKVIAAAVAVLVVVVAIVIGAFYMFSDDSPESKVADAATSYQEAMNGGDLSTLREVTCGADNAYYSKISDEEFAKAYATQKDRNELMRFDEVNAVAIDGDTARVGVDLYNSGDPSKKVPAQITLQKVGDDWKVCKSLN